MFAEIVVRVEVDRETGVPFCTRPAAPDGKRYKFTGMWYGRQHGAVFELVDAPGEGPAPTLHFAM
jgi:hypothetical protein